MLEQILQQIELYTNRHKELKKLKVQRYQSPGISQHLTRDLNIDQLSKISIKAKGQNKNRSDRQALSANGVVQCKKPTIQGTLQMCCAC